MSRDLQLDEAGLEALCLEWFRELGFQTTTGSSLSPEERQGNRQVLLEETLRKQLFALNPEVPASVIEESIGALQRLGYPNLMQSNRAFHRMLVQGLDVSWSEDGLEQATKLSLIDFSKPQGNQFCVVQQLAVQGINHHHRCDLVVYINGLPLAVIELKSDTDPYANLDIAYNQMQTFKANIDSLFKFNVALIISDGIEARIGSLTADRQRFLPWRTVKDEEDRPQLLYQLETLVRGFFRPDFILDYLQHFIIFENDGARIIKKIAAYHQFHAVRNAFRAVLIAAANDAETVADIQPTQDELAFLGKRKGGVVWHTQGSGKSISMACLAGKLMKHRAMGNPTIVVVTDRNDLDGQLYQTFGHAHELLGEVPLQADDRKDLRQQLQGRSAGGILFTTIQKFSAGEDEDRHPVLSDRANIVVLSDEAHRSHYGFKAVLDKETGKYKSGYAKNLRDALPNATFVGFTGTPIATEDRDTRAVFGRDVSVYDIKAAVEDGATVQIYYESRVARLDLQSQIEEISAEATEALAAEEEPAVREALKSKWSTLEKLAGAPNRVREICQDLVQHFEARRQVMPGKGMIVSMSRENCVKLFDQLIQLRPDWQGTRLTNDHGEPTTFNPSDGGVRIVMTSDPQDPPIMRPHHYNKAQKGELERRFKDPDDPLQLVIVRDMWLTGFDAPCCHTMYVDKPMEGYNLMQAIARVNRVFKDKPGGLVVDYIGISTGLRQAMKDYTQANGRGDVSHTIEKALKSLRDCIDIIRGYFHGFDYSNYLTNARALLLPAVNHILKDREDNQPRRFLDHMAALNKAFALCAASEEAQAYRKEIAFFEAVRSVLIKYTRDGETYQRRQSGSGLQKILDNRVISDEVVDVFQMAGMDQPNMGLLSESFLAEVRDLPEKHLAAALLERLLSQQIRARVRRSVIAEREYGERLAEAIRQYHNRQISVVQVVEELMRMAQDLREANARTKDMDLTPDEEAFYDVLANDRSAREQLKDAELRFMAVELTGIVRKLRTVDWHKKDSVQAMLKRQVKRFLKKHGYPPEKREKAIEDVHLQAQRLAHFWAEESRAAEKGQASIFQKPPGYKQKNVRRVVPFPLTTTPSESEKYHSHVPVVPLEVAAGAFLQSSVAFEDLTEISHWMNLGEVRGGRKGQFAAKIVGQSMEPRIKDGSYALFRAGEPVGSRSGRILLFQHQAISDPEHAGSYTLKAYHSEKVPHSEGGFRHTKIELRPENPRFSPIEIDEDIAADLRVVATFLKVLTPESEKQKSTLAFEEVSRETDRQLLVEGSSLFDVLAQIAEKRASLLDERSEYALVKCHFGLQHARPMSIAELAEVEEVTEEDIEGRIKQQLMGLQSLFKGDGVADHFLATVLMDQAQICEQVFKSKGPLVEAQLLIRSLNEALDQELQINAIQHRGELRLLASMLDWAHSEPDTLNLLGMTLFYQRQVDVALYCSAMAEAVKTLFEERRCMEEIELIRKLKQKKSNLKVAELRDALTNCMFIEYGSHGYTLASCVLESEVWRSLELPALTSYLDSEVRQEVCESLQMLKVETVDMVLRKLTVRLETELSIYFKGRWKEDKFNCGPNDPKPKKLAGMIDVIAKKDSFPRVTRLESLRVLRNELSHESVPHSEKLRLYREIAVYLPSVLECIAVFEMLNFRKGYKVL